MRTWDVAYGRSISPTPKHATDKIRKTTGDLLNKTKIHHGVQDTGERLHVFT